MKLSIVLESFIQIFGTVAGMYFSEFSKYFQKNK
jgi:hypothetical protein